MQGQQSGGDRRLQALRALRDQRAQGAPPALPLGSTSSYSPDNMSEVTGHEQQEEDPPVVMFTNEAGEQTPLDPMQGVLFYLENQQGQRTFLERQEGWRDRLPTPNHLRTIPQVLLTRRRWVYATVVDNQMEVINDDWVERPHRYLSRPWFGTVVFFEGQGRRDGQCPTGGDDQDDQDQPSETINYDETILFDLAFVFKQASDIELAEFYTAKQDGTGCLVQQPEKRGV